MPDVSLTREGLALGGVILRWYGLIVVAAALLGILLAARLAARAGRSARYEHLAEQLALHARTEEEVLYPVAVLVGDTLRARFPKD